MQVPGPLGAPRAPETAEPAVRPADRLREEAPLGPALQAAGTAWPEAPRRSGGPPPDAMLDAVRGDAAAWRAYHALTPPQRVQFLQVARQTAVPGGGFGAEAASGPRLNPNLQALLVEGRLNETDSRGVSLLSNLTSLANQRMAEGLHRGAVLQQTLLQVARPGVIHQDSRGTCAATTLEYRQASEDPAEYVRIVAGLTSERGRVTTAGGPVLVRNASGLAPDGTTRSDVSRVYQSTLMDYANGDTVYDNRRGGHLSADGRRVVGDGMADRGQERAQEALFGEQVGHEPYMDLPGARWTADAHFRAELAAGRGVTVSLRWEDAGRDGLHGLLLERMDSGHVYLRNPWGSGDQGQAGAPRELLDGEGRLRMTRDEFYSRLTGYRRQESGVADMAGNATRQFGYHVARGFQRVTGLE